MMAECQVCASARVIYGIRTQQQEKRKKTKIKKRRQMGMDNDIKRTDEDCKVLYFHVTYGGG